VQIAALGSAADKLRSHLQDKEASAELEEWCACRLPPAAYRLPPAACRLPPAARRTPLAAATVVAAASDS
jgi:hypothetical protein